jgi:hypothetical protein
VHLPQEQHAKGPNTDPRAKPNKFKPAPVGRTIVRVRRASYRNAIFDGVFVVANSKDPHGRNRLGHATLEVECHWYGWRPITRWIRITLSDAPEYLKDYKADVVTNLGQ